MGHAGERNGSATVSARRIAERPGRALDAVVRGVWIETTITVGDAALS
jgi:hypothetical protein